ncbi:hypothetical protein Ato02nite_025850 [Paractinoplanes toevensis]|uniref:LysR family transcriptional regulator n=1 Tax=Paractinoplanes toevensis TaxID=571911 RepID=A0A919T978_9ACTN|nr:hypothetical protein Ato02nite_025850 [Actinoplanes toevensis]
MLHFSRSGGALRTDVTTVPLVDPPTRGIYSITPRRAPHPAAAPLIGELLAAFEPVSRTE